MPLIQVTSGGQRSLLKKKLQVCESQQSCLFVGDQILIFHHNLQINSLKILQFYFLEFFFLILSLIVEVYLWWKLQASLIFLSGRTCTIGGWLNTFLPHCICAIVNEVQVWQNNQPQVRGEMGKVNTQGMAPSGGGEKPVREPRSWQSPPPASGSWREEADDAGVFHVVGGPVSPGVIGGTPLWEWDPRYRLSSPRNAPPGRTPPSRPDTAAYRPGAWNSAVHAHDMPPRRRPGWAGESVDRLPPPTPLSDHQRVSAGIHGTWERCGS